MKRGSRPDTSARLKRRRVVQNSSVKMTLQNVILDAELLREIETCVDGVTRTVIEASRFLNFYILKLLEDGEVVPEINQTLLYGAITTLAGSTLRSTVEKFGVALVEYNLLRPPDMQR